MASLVLGAVGAAIGYMAGPLTFLGMSSTSLGWSIGSALGSALFGGGQDITQEGPRLSDLKVQASTYGNPIPIVYSGMRLAGNVIWSTDILETRHEDEQSGGKGGGGGSVTVVSYTYSQSFAVAICEGEISGIRKIWANGKLIYNMSDGAAITTYAASKLKARAFRIYKGSEAQTADSLIESKVGSGNAPGYRGVAYVVFDTLQLADYGNRMPNLEFEVIVSGDEAELAVEHKTLPTTADWVTSAYGNGIFLVLSNGYSPGTVYAAKSADYGGNWTYAATNLTYSVYCCIFADGYFYAGTSTGIWRSADGVAWTQVKSGIPATFLTFDGSTYYAARASSKLLYSSSDGAVWDDGQTISDTAEPWYGVASGGGAIVVVEQGSTAVAQSSYFFGFGYWQPVTIASLTGQLRIAYGNGMFLAVGTNGTAYSTNGINWTAGYSGSLAGLTGLTYGGGVFAICAGSKVYATVDGVTLVQGSSSPSPTKTLYGVSYGNGIFMAVGVNSDYAMTFLPAAVISNVTTEACSEIVADICLRAGLSAGEIDVTDLTDDVYGYVVQRSTARSQIEQLMRAFYFDAVESDGKVKFVKRGSAAALTILEANLAAHEYGDTLPDNAIVSRKQEMELPLEITVGYVDKDAAYQVGAQYSQRLTVESENQLSLNFTVAMPASKAKEIADVLMYEAWTGRTSFDIRTAWKHCYLEPTDVVNIVKDGRTYTIRLTDEDYSVVSARRAVLEDSSVYTQSGTAAELTPPDEDIALLPVTKLLLLDIPLLRDQDEGVGFYAAACGYNDGWPGAQLYKSYDEGATWGSVGAGFLNEAITGVATTALGNFTQNIFDETNSFTVLLTSGDLSSDTEANVLNGSNLALLGNEIIQFKTATLIADGTYTLSGLLRGRFGTERANASHAAGDRFVLLTSSSIYLYPGSVEEYDVERRYRAVTFGGYLDEAETIRFTHTAVARTPLSPVLLGGGRNAAGDLTLNWVRRTRISGGWNNYSDVPLGETSEEYVVEIYDDSNYTNVLRTITGITSATTSYTAAQQTTDFGSPQSTVYWKAYQVSEVVGNGYEARGVT